MRNGCLPKLRRIYLWKSKKEEKAIAKDKEVLKLVDSTAANKNSSLREKEVVADENLGDSLARDINLRVVNVADYGNLDDKITVEQGLESVDVNRTQAKQDLAQHQVKTIRGYKEVAVPKFGDSSNESASGDGFTIPPGEQRPNNELNKIKKEREANAKWFNKVIRTFSLRGTKSSGKGRKPYEKLVSRGAHSIEEREEISNEFHKVRSFDLRGVKSSRQERDNQSLGP